MRHRRPRDLAGRAGLVVALLVGALGAWAVHDAVTGLAAPAHRVADGAEGLAADLRGAERSVARAPLVGEVLAGPVADAAGRTEAIAAAGADVAAGVERLALVGAGLVLVVPAAPVLVVRAVVAARRRRRRREAAAVLALGPGGERLLALRALREAPPEALLALDPDPAGAWLRGDPATTRALALLARDA
ncbi:hypothetical protein [Cellulomonas endophytica]|uniref:hypothetical protein n=1 Tax=Cellulomonas endophytica TaxID=2494735 RepID=UPI00101319C4|nr:hypothetical protein [Cellulomonas endophytica]